MLCSYAPYVVPIASFFCNNNKAHPEVLRALSTGLPNKTLRDVIDSVRRYAKLVTSYSRSGSSNAADAADRTMDSLKEKLAQSPHQADWALPLIR